MSKPYADWLIALFAMRLSSDKIVVWEFFLRALRNFPQSLLAPSYRPINRDKALVTCAQDNFAGRSRFETQENSQAIQLRLEFTLERAIARL